MAVENGVGDIVVDNLYELERLNAIAGEHSMVAPISFRIKPGIDAHTHEFIRTGQVDSKFGLDLASGEAMEALRRAKAMEHVAVKGLHCHIGSQILEKAPFVHAAEVMLQFYAKVRDELGMAFEHLNLGGGFGIHYTAQDDAIPYEEYMEDVSAMVHSTCEKLGLELQIDDMDFDAALLAAQTGKSDMVMAGVTVTEDRQTVMDFSDSYATGIQVVIVPEDSDIASIDDMTGKMIGVQRGTTGDQYCSASVEDGGFGEENVTRYDNGLTAVQALNNSQVDCVVIDNAPAQEFVAANPGLKILDTEYANEEYAIGVAKGNTQLLDAINTAIAELKADGTIQSILDKYISAE